MAQEERIVKLKVTKRRLTNEEKEVQPLVEEGGCGNWYIKLQGGHVYTCRLCWTAPGPTSWPYEECIQLPD